MAMSLTSIIIPAHNEAAVIGRNLRQIIQDARAGEIEVLVVCNGCKDNTAEIASTVGPPVRVLDSPIPSKSKAINLGLEACVGENVIIADADVAITIRDVREIVQTLQTEGVLAAAPRVEMVYLSGTRWSVRAYYAFWMSLPYVREGMMAAGVYALNRQGRNRVGALPDVIADDGYVRMLFGPGERVEALGGVSRVLAPLRLGDLIKIKTRSRLGWFELQQRFPELLHKETAERPYGRAFASTLLAPGSWPAAVVYLYVNVVSRFRAGRQRSSRLQYRWERDEGSRNAYADTRGVR